MKIHFLGQLAQVFGGLGRSDEAFRMIDEAIAALEATGERVSEAELYRSRGILLAETGQPSAGEDSLRQAINVARGQHALLLELRATTTLASLIADDRPAEARTLLSDVMARLTQGAGTPVFREAAAGLSSLRDDATTSASAVAHRRDQ